MHVLHRPHLLRIPVTLAAAALAIVLTLALANAVSDLGSAARAPAGASSPTAALHASAVRPGASTSPFMRNPFSSLLIRPAAPPWSQESP